MNKLFSTAAANLLLAVGTAATSILVARFFGPELRGLYAAVIAIVNTSVAVAVLGTPTYIARIVANREERIIGHPFDLQRAIIISVVISSIAAYSIAFIINWNSRLVQLDWILVGLLATYVPLSVMSVILLNMSLGQANWLAFNVGRLIFVFSTGAGVTIYYLEGGRSLFGVVGSLVIANLLTVICQCLLSKPTARSNAGWLSTARRLYFGARHYALNSLASVSTGHVDFLVLSYLFDARQVGFWAVARTYAALLAPINNAMSFVVFSRSLTGEVKIFSEFRGIVKKFALFNATSAIFLILAADILINIIVGPEYANISSLVAIAIFSVIGASAGELFEERLRGSGRPGPVNVSRFTPLVFLLGALVFHELVSSIIVFAAIYAVGQMIRAFIAMLMTRLFLFPHVPERDGSAQQGYGT